MLGPALSEARRAASLTQGELAAKAALTIPTVRHLERGSGTLKSFHHALHALDLELTGRNLPPGGSIGERVSILRSRRGLSQRKLAELVLTTHPTIVALECRSRGRLKVLELVMTTLGAGPLLIPKGTSLPFYTSAGNASVIQTWQTPRDLLERLYIAFGPFDLDPCSPTSDRRKAPVNAQVHYTEEDDGLSLPWHGVVFLNPPYGRELARWISKAREEVESGRAKTAVALIPARTDTGWWHGHIVGLADIFFLKGRLRFGESVQSAPFPSALVVWGATSLHLEALKTCLPACWHQPANNGNRVSVKP